ncbi:hypothetical protein [Micromonospora sp. NPDC005367]
MPDPPTGVASTCTVDPSFSLTDAQWAIIEPPLPTLANMDAIPDRHR